MLQQHAAAAGVAGIAPRDLRRTCAKMCRAAGGELEQIQLLLGHASVQTTERYPGTRQDLANAPNDRLALKIDGRMPARASESSCGLRFGGPLRRIGFRTKPLARTHIAETMRSQVSFQLGWPT